MSQETKPKGPSRFTTRVRVFVLAELAIGAIFMVTGGLLIYFGHPFAGLATMFVGMWLQFSLMIWRCISYNIAQLMEIAPSLKMLAELLKLRT